MTDAHDRYESALSTRYAGEEMRRLFSARHRSVTWRRLWIALAEAERRLGVPIQAAQVEAMNAALERIDFDAAARYEERFRHDVMAHVHAFGDAAPAARGIGTRLARAAAQVAREEYAASAVVAVLDSVAARKTLQAAGYRDAGALDDVRLR